VRRRRTRPLAVELTLEASELGHGEYEVTLRVANGTLVSSWVSIERAR